MEQVVLKEGIAFPGLGKVHIGCHATQHHRHQIHEPLAGNDGGKGAVIPARDACVKKPAVVIVPGRAFFAVPTVLPPARVPMSSLG